MKDEHAADAPDVVVGVGIADARIDALQAFLEHIAQGAGIAYVVVSRPDLRRDTPLSTLLSHTGRLPVVDVTDGLRLRADHVYLCPRDRHVTIERGCLRVTDDDAAQGLAINVLFRSLAHELGERAVGIVLCDLGDDAAQGLREIRAALGLSMVAKHDTEPVADDASAPYPVPADITLAVEQLPGRLLHYAEHRRRVDEAALRQGDAASDALRQVLLLVQRRTGHDFAAYKQSTVRRRVERRIHVRGLASVQEYAHYLLDSPNEADLLFDELLIGVTSFFRDPAAFAALAELFCEYLRDKPHDYAVRVWVAGCSTGEEAYSLAIVIRECLERAERPVRVQIFATDLDSKAIDVARAGVYPTSIAQDVTPARLQRFFVQTSRGYQVTKEIRDTLIFAPQNLVEDPPFTRVDLLSCRNLLIYLDGVLQRRLFPVFHYLLKPHGLLFLGSSETVGTFTNLFEACEKKWRISRRKEVIDGTYSAAIPSTVPLVLPRTDGAQLSMKPPPAETVTPQLIDRLLFRDLVPPTVLMRERGEILHIHGRTGAFLEPAPGPQTAANIFSMAREGLSIELAAAVRQAAREPREVLRRDVRVQSNGTVVVVDLKVKRLIEPESLQGLFRVSFERVHEDDSGLEVAGPDEHTPSALRLRELERALQYTKENLQGTIEELETANEELKSTNEELQSTNEELQSANEELETSKEELQSLNEELHTVNIELQSKVEELSRANDDMTNLLNATDIAIIFLDRHLNIKRHNIQAKHVIRMIPSDVGRSIGDLVSRLRYGRLVEDAQEVLRTLVYKEIEVQGERDGQWFLMRILPYRTTENVIDGLVVTFVDVTRSKLLLQSEQQMALALRHAPLSVFGVDTRLNVTWACSPVFGIEAASALGKNFDELYGDGYQALSELLRRAMNGAQTAPLRDQMVLTERGRSARYALFIEPITQESARAATCVAVELLEAGG